MHRPGDGPADGGRIWTTRPASFRPGIIMVFLLLALTFLPASAQQAVRLSFGGWDHPMAKGVERILREAYASLGMTIELLAYPPERFMSVANAGACDGVLFGGERIGVKFRRLRKIPVPVGEDDIVVFSKRKQPRIEGWESLRTLRIGIMIGAPEIQEKTRGMRVDPAVTPQQLLLKLAAGRDDVVVLPKLLGLKAIRDLKLASISILPGELGRLRLYHYLSTSKVDDRRITRVLRAMQASGRIRRIEAETKADVESP